MNIHGVCVWIVDMDTQSTWYFRGEHKVLIYFKISRYHQWLIFQLHLFKKKREVIVLHLGLINFEETDSQFLKSLHGKSNSKRRKLHLCWNKTFLSKKYKKINIKITKIIKVKDYLLKWYKILFMVRNPSPQTDFSIIIFFYVV